jgi:hypothetical protein
VGVPAEDERGVNTASLSLDGFKRGRAHGAFGVNIVKPECCIVSRRRMAKIYIAVVNKRWWHAGHPIEVLAFELSKIASGRHAAVQSSAGVGLGHPELMEILVPSAGQLCVKVLTGH